MDDPHDDTDVPSGTTDGAQMESTSPPVVRLYRASERVVAHMRSIALALVQRAVEDKRVRCLAQILG